MKIRGITSTILFSFIVFTGLSINTGKSKPELKLALHLNPDHCAVSGIIEYIHPSDSIFLLTDGLTVELVKADDKIVDCVSAKPDASLYSSEFSLPFLPKKLVIHFSGTIKPESYPKTISNLNLITCEMFELTDMIDWYPKMKKGKEMIYSLTVDLPSGFKLVTNGMQINESVNVGRKIAEFISSKPVYGISLLGSVGMKKLKAETNDCQLEIYYSQLPDSYIDSMSSSLLKTVSFYNNLYLSKGSDSLVRIIYSPRGAGGYARGSVIVVSEEYALEQRKSKFGPSRDFHLNAHEIAHLWSKANAADDWINEGLAEYSAFLASEKFIGTEFAKMLLNEYNAAIENSATQLSISETTDDSWESHINRYYKPTVLLNTLRQKYGEEKMAKFIASLDAAFIQNHGGTTGLFLQTLEEKLGNEAYNFFTEGLNRKNWNKISEAASAGYEADFEGTWTGGLTQFGTTSKFVLHLKKDDNKLIPVLDSPDQDVFGIPVSELKLSGDSITCVVGVASATYSGKLDRKTKTIHGNWNQRGTDYPLNISKE